MMNAEPNMQVMQRSQGEAMVSLGQGTAGLRLLGLRQQGSAKCILPFGVKSSNPEIVFLNTSGGLTGGDRLSYRVQLGVGVRATATTQTAERAYRANEAAAEVRVSLEVGAGGWVDWLPQETILFDQSALNRRTVITLDEDAGCLLLETVILGRAAMGETLARLHLHDWREVRQGGKPILIEPLSLTDAALSTGPAGLNGNRAFSTLALIAPHAADQLGPLRAILNEPGVEAAASALPGRLMLRLAALDGWPLRRQVARALRLLRPDAALPRVWQM